MCFSPVVIRNPKKNPVPGLDSKFLAVPCNHCPECRMHRQDDWYVRNFFEYDMVKNSGGYAQLFTLTYRPSKLPKCTHLNIPCFSRRDIQLFLKLLRDKVGTGLRFFMASEYGDEKHRPHYHFVFYCPSHLDREFLKKSVAKSWHGGILYTSNINDGLVLDVRGIRYAAKYAVKDLLQDGWFLKQRNILKESLKMSGDMNRPSYREYCEAQLKEFEKHRPFVQTSLDFGMYFFQSEYFNRSLAEDGYVRIPSYKKVEGDKFKLPLYFERKMFYKVEKSSVHGHNVYVLTDYGRHVMDRRFKLQLEALDYRVHECINVFKSPKFLAYCYKVGFKPVSSSFNVSYDFMKCYLVYNKFHGLDIPKLIGYDLPFLDEKYTLSPRSFYRDLLSYRLYSNDSEFSLDDGVKFTELGEEHLKDMLYFFRDPAFMAFHESYTRCCDFLKSVANERQRRDESLAVQAKIYKRRMLRSKQANYVE